MSGKTSFILYHEHRKPLERLTDEQRGKLLLAIFDYSERGEVLLSDDGALLIAFDFIRGAIDRDAAAWEEKCERRRAAGARGGQARAENAKQKQANQANAKNAKQTKQKQANQAEHDHDHEHDHEHEHENNIIKAAKPPRASRFTPPTVDEVREYCSARGGKVDPNRFVDFYEAKGWMVGKNKMKDWRAAVRSWEQRQAEDGKAGRNRGYIIGDITDPSRYTFKPGESL